NIATATIGAIQRRVVALGDQGAEQFFGEPALDIVDILQLDEEGRGYINILSADKLMLSPKAYSVFLLWLLAELFEKLPEAGDREKPKCVLFFDEAHLLFDDAPKALLRQIETVVRLIRSKSVGVYFISQSTSDMPDDVLGQLGNRIQHALRAFTPKDQKVVRAAAETFRTDDSFDTEAAILELGVGEALVSLLDSSGTPTFTERALIRPPLSRLGAISTDERNQIVRSCALNSKYAQTVDRESAYEVLKKKARAAQDAADRPEEQDEEQEAPEADERPADRAPQRAPRTRQGPIEAFVVSTVRAVGSQVGRQLVRGVLGSLLGGRRR
ncbi:MAG: DUF853 family protein, partial [Deltaproteobacteria bacterium]|nr:DUF853 family protein [Deltaproteobacteria bacterium]